MANVCEVYTQAVHRHLAPLFANWEPGNPARLGTIGELRGAMFVPEGQLDDHGIVHEERAGKTSDHRTFTTDESVSVGIEAGAVARGVRGSIQIRLGRTDSVFFNAAGCTYRTITHKPALAQDIMGRYQKGRWERHWAVVTDLVEAQSVIIAVGGGRDGHLRLEATSDAGTIDLTNAGVRFNITSEASIGYKFVASAGSLLLLGLSKIQRRWWFGSSDLRTMNLLQRDPDEVDEEEEEDLFFGQLR